MQEKYLCGARIKQIYDEIEKQANALLRQQDLALSQMNVLMELDTIPGHSLTLKELESLLHVAQPVADLLSSALVVFLYLRTVKRMEANSRKGCNPG